MMRAIFDCAADFQQFRAAIGIESAVGGIGEQFAVAVRCAQGAVFADGSEFQLPDEILSDRSQLSILH